MNNIQFKKNKKKLNIIEELIYNISDYNSISGYTNLKRININIGKNYAKNETSILYDINISRGIHEPKEILDMHLVFDNIEDTAILNDFLNRIINSKYYKYSSCNMEYNEFVSFSLHMNNEIIVNINVKDKDTLNIVNSIIEMSHRKIIIIKPKEESNKTKDEIQIEKAQKTFNFFTSFMRSLSEYNNLEGYKNTKPYIFSITYYYDGVKQCYVYSLSIIKDSYTDKKLLTKNISINNKNILYNLIYDLLYELKSNNKYFIEKTSNSFEDFYEIALNNKITYKFFIRDMNDKEFYNSIKDNILTEEKKQLLLK